MEERGIFGDGYKVIQGEWGQMAFFFFFTLLLGQECTYACMIMFPG